MRGEAHITVVDQQPSPFADLRGAKSREHPASRGSPPSIQRSFLLKRDNMMVT